MNTKHTPTIRDLLTNLIDQIQKTSPVDALGHGFEMNQTYFEAVKYLNAPLEANATQARIDEFAEFRAEAAKLADDYLAMNSQRAALQERIDACEKDAARWQKNVLMIRRKHGAAVTQEIITAVDDAIRADS